MASGWPQRSVALLAGVLSSALLAYNTGCWRSGDLESLRTPRRYWEDVAIAMSWLGRDVNEVASPVLVGTKAGQTQIAEYERYVKKAGASAGIQPWQFWLTIPTHRFEGRPRLEGRASDDTGRSQMLSWAFRLLGGVSPYLPLWLAALAAVPILFWIAWELSECGRPCSAVLVPLIVASSPFVVEVFSLPYSGIGFYVLTLLCLAPLATYTTMHPSPRPVPLLIRSLAAGAYFALGTLCRSGTTLLGAGFALALIVGGWRIFQSPWQRRAGTAAILLAFALPLAVFARPRHHEAWLGIWEGLGDYDRTKGHTWHDTQAKLALVDAGIPIPRGRLIGNYSEKTEGFFREQVLHDITSDPAWYAGILAKRLFTTLTFPKLWPRARREAGASMTPRDIVRGMAKRTSPNEGAINTYWKLTTPVDYLGCGRYRWELPVAMICTPTLLLLMLWASGRWLAGTRALAAGAAPDIALLGCLALAALVAPLLITTASAMETEAFVIVYYVGFALLVQQVVTLLSARLWLSKLCRGGTDDAGRVSHQPRQLDGTARGL